MDSKSILPCIWGLMIFGITFSVVTEFCEFTGRDMTIGYILGFILGLTFSIAVSGNMYKTRKWTITISFKDKQEFMKKLNMAMFKINYKLESNQGDFHIYKLSWYKIAVTLSQNEATIVGPKCSVVTLQDSLKQ